jgi:hypothetical protein
VKEKRGKKVLAGRSLELVLHAFEVGSNCAAADVYATNVSYTADDA